MTAVDTASCGVSDNNEARDLCSSLLYPLEYTGSQRRSNDNHGILGTPCHHRWWTWYVLPLQRFSRHSISYTLHVGGLGSETAKLLHAKGCHLALLYAPFEASRRESVLASAFGEATPAEIRTYECDITSEASVNSAFEKIRGDLPVTNSYPSILINAAGYVSVQPIEETTAEEASKNIIPNLMGPFIVSNAFFKLYNSFQLSEASEKKPPGALVSISSQAAHVALPGHAAYCASKAGLLGLVRSQALEWGPHGVTSNTVSPTVALTELGKKAWADDAKRKAMQDQIPTGRFCEPSEISNAMEWLCRDENGMIQ